MPKPQFVASRAEIVEDEPEENVQVAGDTSQMFKVVNIKTGAVVGMAKTLNRAKTILDKHDNAYGGYAHKIVRPITPTPAG
jgi:hypothetical protein